MVEIRKEQPQDIPLIHQVNKRAFGQLLEADLVDRLRRNCKDLLSLVAVAGNEIVGHILFSSVTVEGEETTAEGMALAPMAVLPEHQRQGIGSKLVRAGIARLVSSNCAFVIVLGHADYYPRFGFKPAHSYGVRCEWEVPDDAFMILVLNESVMQGISGVARYRPEFAEAVEPE